MNEILTEDDLRVEDENDDTSVTISYDIATYPSDYIEMIAKEYVGALAKYNACQITSIDKLTDQQRTEDMGAFFGSI